ncbi:MAG TPA: tRNA uridine-5-carboxymethylaminomethyl(34) synthesis GTPase MnmE, partial [Parachlamydiaceae bacterium]|nr:tRNA uridine-5-carboxymethylaminomethyl(34) synthesis GTPase MnmE [Parachlamydiaceae bacterium]
IIRVSGKDALKAACNFFSGPVLSYKSHTAHFGQIIDENGQKVDDVLLLIMLGKRSYTGEDTVEVHCHGGSLITRRVLEVILKSGVKAANPGEFTFKAFMNGKLDLSQAEAVQELIAAKNEKALDAAANQLQGKLSEKISSFQKELTEIAAILEAWVDFPEEGLEFASMEEICQTLEDLIHKMNLLVDTFHDGKIVHEGLSICLIGSPNVGKSSLMNALLDKERAIVSDIPGTTRDTLEDLFRLNGLNFKLTDTAGIRETKEAIEKEGIRRSSLAMQEADLVLFVLDSSVPLKEEDRQLAEKVPAEKTIAILNKADLQTQMDDQNPILTKFSHTLSLSAKTKKHLDLLHQKIDEVIWKNGPPSKEEALITNVRHKESLVEAKNSCTILLEGLKSGISPEFLSIDIRDALKALGKVIGTDVSEDILSAIFSKFCIGK